MLAKFFRLSLFLRLIISIWLFLNVEAPAMVSSMRLGSIRVYSSAFDRSLLRMESCVILFMVDFLLIFAYICSL